MGVVRERGVMHSNGIHYSRNANAILDTRVGHDMHTLVHIHHLHRKKVCIHPPDLHLSL